MGGRRRCHRPFKCHSRGAAAGQLSRLGRVGELVDARGSGGLGANPAQALNVAVSLIAAIAVAVALPASMNAVLAVFGIWAIAAGLAQLITGVRRWRAFGAQWAMILSGAQSMLAGVFFVTQAGLARIPTIMDVAPYAAFGAFYFMVSAGLVDVRKSAAGRLILLPNSWRKLSGRAEPL